MEKILASVSSVFSNSGLFAGEFPIDVRPQNDEGCVVAGCARWRPAFSRSESDHDRMVARSESISKRFASARGVVRNWRRILVTSLLSTLVSEELRLRRRRASIRCSLIITAKRGKSEWDGFFAESIRTFVS